MSAADDSHPGPEDTEFTEDAELLRVLEVCLADIEAGRPVDLERVAAGNPALAGRLRTCLAGLQAVEREGATMAGAVAASGPALRRRLGDYVLLREVGRGGMGIVYEAEQVSLGRRVAVKVLPYASTLDPRSLQRFQNEARAVAGLRHAHIVPIFAVGCEDGVHFYAMQFVAGRTLAALARHDSCDTPTVRASTAAPAGRAAPAGPGIDARTAARPGVEGGGAVEQ